MLMQVVAAAYMWFATGTTWKMASLAQAEVHASPKNHVMCRVEHVLQECNIKTCHYWRSSPPLPDLGKFGPRRP